jgi:hypothetical protein
MNILVVSDSTTVQKKFETIEKSKTYNLQFCSYADMRKKLALQDDDFFAYLHIDGIPPEQRENALRFLSRSYYRRYGIVDSRGDTKDVALFFHQGASDYIGKTLLTGRIDGRRLRRVLRFAASPVGRKSEKKGVRPALQSERCLPSGKDWSGVREGQEYTFYLMYVELDNQSALKNQFSDTQLNIAVNRFKSFIERTISVEHGKIWMWNEFGGLILFPYDGKSFDAVLACMRIIISRTIFSIEELNFKKLVSYRIALHLGNTVYRRKGDTGTIISSSINTIFHLGKRYVKPGNFFITSDVYRHLTQKVQKSFRTAGSFEGRSILRMRLPV